jgi:hypothetical protein
MCKGGETIFGEEKGWGKEGKHFLADHFGNPLPKGTHIIIAPPLRE